jgi:hypothetical protein
VEDFEEITIRHSKYAASRFAHEAAPALTRFAHSSPMPFVNGIKTSAGADHRATDDERTEFLRNRGFGKSETAKIIETVLAEEGRKPQSVFDFVRGLRQLRATNYIRMLGSSSSRGRKSCLTEWPETRKPPSGFPVTCASRMSVPASPSRGRGRRSARDGSGDPEKGSGSFLESNQGSPVAPAEEDSAATGYETAVADPDAPAENALDLPGQTLVAAA